MTRMTDLTKSSPKLKAAWEEYGFAVSWDKLDGYKKSHTHGYIVLRWKEDNGMVNMADLAYNGETWEVQNDGFEPISEADWRKLKVVPDCDWFEIPGNPNFPSLGS